MKKNLSDMAKPRLFASDLTFRTTAILLFLTLLSIWFVSGLYARYTVSDSYSDSARVAEGLPAIELLEHEAVLTNGEYVVNSQSEVKNNTYSKVIPGVDIQKDPFVRLTGSSEVDFELYIKVVENNFPTYTLKYPITTSPVTVNSQTAVQYDKVKAVTYDLRDSWKCIEVDDEAIIYQYADTEGQPIVFKAGIQYQEEIYIIKDDILKVSEHYVGGGQNFSLTFEAWIKQVD